MSKEIERRFIVSSNKWKKFIIDKWEVQQGYLSKSDKHNVRVRIKKSSTASKGYITVKGKPVGCTRDEFEYEIPIADAQELMVLCESKVKKTRYYLQLDKKCEWIVDVFKGINKGLVLSEVEFAYEGQKVTIPNWIGREVTHDRRYTSSYLSSHKVTPK